MIVIANSNRFVAKTVSKMFYLTDMLKLVSLFYGFYHYTILKTLNAQMMAILSVINFLLVHIFDL